MELAAQYADNAKCPWQMLVPSEYHKYGKVSSKVASQRFPKSRQWDYAIHLVQDIPEILDCKMYPLAKGQQRNLDKFLDKHLEKGYIHVSNSSYCMPHPFSLSRKRMVNRDLYKITGSSMSIPYGTPIHSH